MIWFCFLFQKHMDVYVNDCFDSIAIFLCIHIMFRYKNIMHKRSVPALDKWVALFRLLQSWKRHRINLTSKFNTHRNLAFFMFKPSKPVVVLRQTWFVCQVLGDASGDDVATVRLHHAAQHTEHPRVWPCEAGSHRHQATLCRSQYFITPYHKSSLSVAEALTPNKPN